MNFKKLLLSGVFILGVSHGAVAQIACTMDAKMCPDGSYVSRSGPHCEFAPCPDASKKKEKACTREAKICPDGSTVSRTGADCAFAPCPDQGGSVGGGVVGGSVGDSTDAGGAEVSPDISPVALPEEALINMPDGAVSMDFLVRHRMALSGQHVKVKGFVVATLLAGKDCPKGMCVRPRITLADTASSERDTTYDVVVLLSDEKKHQAQSYQAGQSVEIEADVIAVSDESVTLEQK